MIVPSAHTALRAAAEQRILVLDGAMGTMIQALGLDEEAFRGAHFDAWNSLVRGNKPSPARFVRRTCCVSESSR